jgi:hypothetical protein
MPFSSTDHFVRVVAAAVNATEISAANARLIQGLIALGAAAHRLA